MKALIKNTSVKRLVDRADPKKGFIKGRILDVMPIKQIEELPPLGENERFYKILWDNGVVQNCPRSFLITDDNL